MHPKTALLDAHLRADLCYSEAKLCSLAAHWPDDVTLSWLLRNPQRGRITVSDTDSIYRACKLLAGNADGRARLDRALRVIVLRAARVHAADACEAAGLAQEAAALRAIADDATLETIRKRCAAAARAAAELRQQVIDLADAAEGWTP
jgi:hypothetical protein